MKVKTHTSIALPSAVAPTRLNTCRSVISGFRLWVSLFCLLATLPAFAQAIRFRVPQVRVTVPINSTMTTIVTNSVNLSGVTNATFDISGLPAGAGAILTDTNSVIVTSVNGDTNLWLVVSTTNIAEGVYTYSLNASGFDTNGLPVTNNIFLVLQAAHIWNGANGALGVSSAWTAAGSWLGGVPTSSSDVIFSDIAAQTNAFTNSLIDANFTIASLRFSQSALTNSVATNTAGEALPRFHTLSLAPNTTLSVTGTNGFSLMRDYIDGFYNQGPVTDYEMGVTVVGGAGSRLVVSNASANFALLVAQQAFGGSLLEHAFLNLSNVNSMVAYVNRMGIADYRLYPHFRNYNDANGYSDNPSRFLSDVLFPRTNIITAIFKDPENYTNELIRTYAFTLGNNETEGNGSANNSFIYLGQSNAFFLDSFCIGQANYAIGNGGQFRFNPNFPNATAIFRSTNNGRMSVFTVSDNGGTNRGTDTTRMNTIDFASGNGLVDILVDRFYMSRDRQLIASNSNPVVESALTIGRGIVDANTAILGFQEHNGKDNWPAISGGAAEAYRNYCRADLTVTNGGTFKVNGTLTLGYTADTNPAGSAEQFNTRGTITVQTNSFAMVSNVVVDGGLNFYNGNGRANAINLSQGGTFIITNSIGGAPGLPLDTLNMNNANLVLQNIDPARTNIYVRNLLTPGTSPTTIRVVSISGVSSYPVQIPVISYENAAPFLVANVSALGAGFVGYVLDNVANKTVDLFITTNPPNSLIWVGNLSADWDTTTKNWVTAVGGLATNFTLGDSVTFNDSSAVTNINIVNSVVPGQAGTGVTVSNTIRNYTISGGAIAGTGLLLKNGSGQLTLDVVKQGPVTANAGTLSVGLSGSIGVTTIGTNATLNCSGVVNGGLTSAGNVTTAPGSQVIGGVTIQTGSLLHEGTIDTGITGAFTVSGRATVTNNGTINLQRTANPAGTVDPGCIFANFGTFNNIGNRLNVNGLFFGTGSVLEADGGLVGVDARFNMLNDPSNFLSPGTTPYNSIGTMNLAARVDLTGGNPNNNAGTLLVEVDFAHAQTNDIIQADRWNNIGVNLVMTNINPGAGSFGPGQVFQILKNNNGLNFSNFIDTAGIYPWVEPVVPAPGLQWDLSGIRIFGTLGITNSAMVWNGGTGIWSTNVADVNWQGPTAYSDGLGAILNDSASGTTTITIAGDVFPSGTNVAAPSFTPGIVVSNTAKDYTLTGNGRISGLASLYKIGSGTLTILTTNNFTGSTTIEGGTVVITNGASVGVAGNQSAYNRLTLDGTTLRYIGNYNGSIRPTVINANNATIEVTSATNQLQASATTGPGRLTKTGPGTLFMAADSGYSGGTVVSNGTLLVNGQGRVGTNTVTLAGGTLYFSGAAFTLTNSLSVVGSGSRIINTNPYVSSGLWSGSGTLTISNSSTLSLSNSISGYSGAITFSTNASNLRFNNATNANLCTGSAAASFDLGTGSASISNFNGAGLTYHLGSLSGGPNTLVAGRFSNATAHAASSIYSIGANGQSTVFSGRIVNGADTVSVVKVGTGTLALNGTNTYTGSTTVSNGTLGGHGVISGPLTVTAAGTLAPGTSAGKLTVNNSVTLSGTTVMELDRIGGVSTNDQLAANAITAGGTLIVTNIGPVIFNNTTFKLFTVPVSGFTSVTLPAGYTWNNTLSTDGNITLVSGGTVNTNPPTITSFSSGGGTTLNLSWPATHIGWSLQVQTNALTVGISTNWATVAGSSATNNAAVGIDPTAPTVFYRLIYP